MSDRRSICFFSMAVNIIFLVVSIDLSLAQQNFTHYWCVDSYGNYSDNSTFQSNLNGILSSVPSDSNESGFYNLTAGDGDDKIELIAFCRGDVESDICRSCLEDSAVQIVKTCPNHKQAIGYYEKCTIRYSNRSIFHTVDNYVTFTVISGRNATDQSAYSLAVGNILGNLRINASSGSSVLKFATGDTKATDFGNAYALEQCTPDLSGQQCNDCLEDIINEFGSCCAGRTGARLVRPSCMAAFGQSRFYNGSTVPASPSPPPVPGSNSSNSSSTSSDGGTKRTVIIVLVTVGVAILLLGVSACWILKKRTSWKKLESPNMMTPDSIQFDFNTISVATNNFSTKLGQGGFGAVYKGRLVNGQEVAVKRLDVESWQGDVEFRNEVLLLSKLRHRNLVRLLGFCLEREERLLVYEFVPNRSLDYFLFDTDERSFLDWGQRYKIIKGIAKGLQYLHEDSRFRIIHRDLKAANILLDVEMNPKISDFGTARLFAEDEVRENTMRIAGTRGYMAPEYAVHGFFSVKSDVFSFGVMVLEIVTDGRNVLSGNGEEEGVISSAWRNWREGTPGDVVDPRLMDEGGSIIEMTRCIHIGLLCVQVDAEARPTMGNVLLMMSSDSVTLDSPHEPVPLSNRPFFLDTISEENKTSSSHESIYTSTLSRTEKDPR